MRKLFISFLFCFIVTLAYSQLSSLKGVVVDSVEKSSLQNTVISLLRKSDTVLVKFTRADKAGLFTLSRLNAGSYILMATHPYFGDFVDSFDLK
ncbi:MAG TPA: carboxypeptidase-like regulatory domain-containing protein, partial [Chitinophagaceae bacterium]|nr:carboxypeptidase-like regulatory domain-containing protein [Chitinophagaceae bacterium]